MILSSASGLSMFYRHKRRQAVVAGPQNLRKIWVTCSLFTWGLDFKKPLGGGGGAHNLAQLFFDLLPPLALHRNRIVVGDDERGIKAPHLITVHVSV